MAAKYGEMLPGRAYDNAIGMIRMADCLIIGGTSLEVGSAAQLAHMYHGKHLIIINKSRPGWKAKRMWSFMTVSGQP